MASRTYQQMQYDSFISKSIMRNARVTGIIELKSVQRETADYSGPAI
jgi:hypothetical protein